MRTSLGSVVPPILSPWHSMLRNTRNQYHPAQEASATASVAWGAANFGLLFPVWVPGPCNLTRLYWINGGVLAGNVDAGVYDDEGNRLVSLGGVAQAGPNVGQVATIDKDLAAGWYLFGLALANSAGTIWTQGGGGINGYAVGAYATVYPLPAKATLGTINTVNMRKFGALVYPRTIL